MQKLTIIFIAVLGLFLVPWGAKAESVCTSDRTTYDVDLQTVFVPPGAQVGDILKIVSNTVNITCGNEARNQQISRVSHPNWTRTGMLAQVDGISCPVLDTDMGLGELGLGIVWTNFNSSAGTWGCMSNYFPGMNANGTRRGLKRNGTAIITDNFYIIKTKSDLDYGKVGQIEQSIYLSEGDPDNTIMGDLYSIYFHGDIELSKGGCSVETHKAVDMGNVSTKMFQGVGSVGAEVPFTITLSECEGNAVNVLLALEPTYGYADKNNGVIALSDEEGAASGVGIQLLLNGQKIDGNAEYLTWPFQKGVTTIPFSARYYQVADSVRPGVANSTLVFYTWYE